MSRTLDDAMQDFMDEFGSQFLSLEGPDIKGQWRAEVITGGVTDAIGVSANPVEAVDEAVRKAKAQERVL